MAENGSLYGRTLVESFEQQVLLAMNKCGGTGGLQDSESERFHNCIINSNERLTNRGWPRRMTRMEEVAKLLQRPDQNPRHLYPREHCSNLHVPLQIFPNIGGQCYGSG